MKRVRDLPLGDKLIVVGVASSALALIAASVIFLLSNLIAVRGMMRDEVSVQAAMVAENTAPAVLFKNPSLAAETLRVLRVTGAKLVCVYDVNHRLFPLAPEMDDGCPAAPPDPAELDRWTSVEAISPLMFQEQRQGTLYLRGSFDGIWSRMTDQLIAALAGIALGIVVAVALSRWVHRIIAEPIVRLSTTAGRIARAGDYSLRAGKVSADEIGQLVDAFNGMVAEVERRDDQLRAASRLKDEFLAALSHELRTPLNAVLGWIQVLRTTPVDTMTEARAYESIERNARAQASLIEDLLDISRIVSGKLRVKSEPVDLVGAIESALEVVRPTAEAKQITIARRLLPPPQIVIGDAQRLQQIAWNLLSNAVKFTSRGGTVEVSLGTDGDAYVFAVRDNGLGIAPDFLPDVFDRFRQADGSITRRHGGLGLGLAIARELTQLHGGRIQASSAGEEQGAVFTITLPKAPAASGAAAGPPGAITAIDGLSLLVVDDDRDATELASALLTGGGARVRTAASAEEALRAMASDRFDVLLCDLAMPGIDGFELMQLIREDSDAPHHLTPAVAVSAHAGAAAESRARASGYDAFVAKPFGVDQLVAAIRLALSRPM